MINYKTGIALLFLFLAACAGIAVFFLPEHKTALLVSSFVLLVAGTIANFLSRSRHELSGAEREFRHLAESMDRRLRVGANVYDKEFEALKRMGKPVGKIPASRLDMETARGVLLHLGGMQRQFVRNGEKFTMPKV